MAKCLYLWCIFSLPSIWSAIALNKQFPSDITLTKLSPCSSNLVLNCLMCYLKAYSDSAEENYNSSCSVECVNVLVFTEF